MGKRGNVADDGDVDTGVGDGPDSSLTARSGTFHKYLHGLETAVVAGTRYFGSSYLGSIRGVLFRTPEAHFASGRPANHITSTVGD